MATSATPIGIFPIAMSDVDIEAALVAAASLYKFGVPDGGIDFGGALIVGANIDAGGITSGTIDTARLGSLTANSSTFLRGDQTWATIAGTGDLGITKIAPAANAAVTAGYACYIADGYELAAGVETELESGAILEIG
jgi:hypothetical protein